MRQGYQIDRWQEPVRWVDTRDVAEKLVETWIAEADHSRESLIMAIDATMRGVLKALCDG